MANHQHQWSDGTELERRPAYEGEFTDTAEMVHLYFTCLDPQCDRSYKSWEPTRIGETDG